MVLTIGRSGTSDLWIFGRPYNRGACASDTLTVRRNSGANEDLPIREEGPHWDIAQQCLYYVGIDDKSIHKYDYRSGKTTKASVGGKPGFIVPVQGTKDQFIIGLDRVFVILRWDGEDGSKTEIIKVIAEVDNHSPGNRINDGKADPKGRIYAGTMGKESSDGQFQDGAGSFYMVDGSKVKLLEENIGISNGLAWNLKEKAFFYVDSLKYNVRRFDYDVDTGNISNPSVVVDFKENNWPGFPDGMAIDTEDKLWIACFEGSRVIRVDPQTGKLLRTVDIPAHQVTSVAFGGPNLDVLFVTTAANNLRGEQKAPCGSTFMVKNLGVRGLPAENYVLRA